ncbi:MAG: DegT/DnrJ/EryC1/StrS family aminotransferase [Candidatus Helarchaeota archaeon]|nr:DegT/DnrJ/EryC1/StrS family aminotransferase [Candidatus Helarchaeota archaeon]
MKIPPAKPYFPSEDMPKILEDIKGVLESGMLTLGKFTKEFEANYAKYCGTKYAIAVNSGTSALEIALRCLRIKPDDEVIVPTNTFVATPNSVIFADGKPVFADIERDTLCIDPEDLNERITPKTKGVIVVHIGGLVSPSIKAIQEICADKKLFLIEDAAHAQGSDFNGKKAGTFGVLAGFSFYPTKVMTTAEGGIITTNSEEYTNLANIMRDQGKSGFLSGEMGELGYNWRMSEVHAVIGVHQLKRLEEFIASRIKIANYYDKELLKIKRITPLKIPKNCRSNFYKYIAFITDDSIKRADLKKELKEKYTVSLSGEVYDIPCHLQPIYKKLYNTTEGMFPVTEEILPRHICLPIYSDMTIENAKYVIESIKKVIG